MHGHRVVNPHPGQYICSCQGYLFSGHCRHIRMVQFCKGEIDMPLALTDIRGIGPAYKAKLAERGIINVIQLAACSEADLVPVFGNKAADILAQAKKISEQLMVFRDAFDDYNRVKIMRGHITTGSKSLDYLIDPCLR